MVPTLRFLSVNAASLPLDRARLARVIEADAPDVVVVHGAPSALRWRSKCGAIARQAGLVVVDGGRTGGGTLLLSSLGVDVEATRTLAFAGVRRGQLAGAVLAVMRHRGRPFALAAGRLLGNSVSRSAQAGELQAVLADFAIGDPPAVLSVDGADRPGTAAWQARTSKRTSVAAGVFVDDRIVIDARREVSTATNGYAPLALDLLLPG